MTDVSNRSGGADLHGERIDVGQDVVGRDKIVQNITQQVTPTQKHDSLPNQPYFFGRKDELEKIANALDPEAQGWGVLISGPGGIGKTALAVRAGHLAFDKDYPIKIFLSAKITQLTPQGVEDLQDFMLPDYMTLLAELARELGDENIAKIDPAQRANEVRRSLADRHALIIIDNLETFDEQNERPRVFQFLSRLPRTCKAIVTSRRRIDTPAEIIRLDRLKQEDALELIAKLTTRNKYLAKATDQERLSLYEITRGNPLLIEWIAGQLGNAKSQCHTIANAIRFLGNAPKDNDPLSFVFGDLLDTFTEHETAVLAALTYFTRPAKVKWIADIAAVTTLQVETALEDLADRSVLVYDEKEATYFLPPLTATFLRHARPEVIVQAGNSLSDYAFALALENGYQEFERFPVLEAEWPMVAAAIPLLVQGNNERLQELCDAVFSFLNFSGRWDELLSLSSQAEDKATTARDTWYSGWRAHDAGYVFYLRGQAAEVLDCAQRAESHWAKVGARERAFAIRLRGLGHQLAQDYTAAITAYREAVNLLYTFGPENEDVVIGLNNLGEVERLSNDYAAAEHDYREALRIARKINYHEGVATYVGSLAELALDLEQWHEAEQLAREALPLGEGVGRQDLIAHDCRCLAKACARQEHKTEGLPYAQRAVAIYTKLRSPELEKAQAVLKECEEGTQQIDSG